MAAADCRARGGEPTIHLGAPGDQREQQGRQPAAKRVAVLADPVLKAGDLRVRERVLRRAAASTKALTDAQAASTSVPQSLAAAALERSAGDVRLMDGADFPRLEYTRELARAVLAQTPAEEVMQALDFKASRATATSRDLSQYRTVVFATHGLLNSKHPELSGLVLSLVDEQGKAVDGFLRLHDVYNMTLNAELVVLGACETGLGKEIRGEGLVGLTRGFMYAGARRVMASLWKVDEDATVELIQRMYTKMEREGQTPAAALRAVQVAMLKEKRFSSPYYWAGFILQGEYK